MKIPAIVSSTLPVLLLSGCLEVEQHPLWVHGEYDGKPDNLPHQVHFHNDRLAWSAAIADRNRLQNEYDKGRMEGGGT
jgi:hypothetical protein